MKLRLVIISDTHGLHESVSVPDGDILVHAGDITMDGRLSDAVAFDRWLGALPHRRKVVIAGNHDFCFERDPAKSRACLTNAIYLQDEAAEIEGLKFYGSPWQPWFFDWAFNLARGPELRAKWNLIPADTDVLVTHGPPQGCLDMTRRGEPVGCADLAAAVRRLKPRLHVFGHIHEAYEIGRASCRERVYSYV
jgi:predicted phosphohydrolase